MILEITQEDIDAAYACHHNIWWFDPYHSPIAIAALRQGIVGARADYDTIDGKKLSPEAKAYQVAFGHSLYGEFKVAEYQAAKHFRANTGNTGAIELKSTKQVKPIVLVIYEEEV